MPKPTDDICDECGARLGDHRIGPGGYHPNPVTTPEPSTRALNLALMAQRDDVTAHEVALEIDRFAAQRGAEAGRLVHLFARVIVEGDGAFTGEAWEAALCEAERINRGAPPQTGGGDAEWVCAVLYRVTEYLAKTGTFAEEDIAALRKALTMLDTLHNGPKGTQTGSGDARERALALVQEFRAYLCNLMIDLDEPEIEWMTEKLEVALRSSHREGAEAMREACARLTEHGEELEMTALVTRKSMAAAIRALPIPGS